MFFHEILSTSARLVVAQHGYESVIQGLRDNLGHFTRVLDRHGIEVAPELVSGAWQVPVRAIDTGELPERLARTIFRTERLRRDRDDARDPERVEKFGRATSEAAAIRPAREVRKRRAGRPAAAARGLAAGTPRSRTSS
jgi:hypothetical protein